MQRGNGAVIGKQNTPTTSVATGVWALNEVQRAVLNGTWPAAAVSDPYFENVTMLLHGDGTNGAQNNTFLDSSTNNFTITRNGNTTQGTFTPFGSNWSNYFDGSGDYLSCGAANQASSTFTGDFTIEAWFNFSSIAADCAIVFCLEAGPPELGWNFRWRQASSGFRFFSTSVGTFDFSYTPTVGVWTHVALSRSGTNLRCFVNGAQIGTTQTASGTVSRSTANPLQVGGGVYNATSTNGYLSNVRIVNGTAVYTANFTPPTSPLTAITNTSLLTCQSNRFIDNSTNAFTITVNGNTSVQRFSPFNPTAPYAAGTDGGSGYFDGSGDSLTAADNAAFEFGASDFTVEAWVYVTAAPGGSGATIVGKNSATYPGGYEFNLVVDSARTIFFGAYTTTLVSLQGAIVTSLNSWNHVAAVRSGSNWALFVNGVRDATATSSGTIQSTSSSLYIGDYGGGSRNLTGYCSNIRLVKGSAVYDPSQSTLTVPTSPLTAITNTSFLTNFTNAGIIDNAEMNNLETVGNAQISTSVKKFGTGSLSFDGNGDYLQLPNRSILSLEGDFTIEGWIYVNSLSAGSSTFLQLGDTSNYIILYISSSDGTFRVAGTVSITSGTVSTGAWKHFALVRNGTASGNIKAYVDGVNTGSATSTATFVGTSNNGLRIGAEYPSNYYLNGYIDDLRITKGYARYTANFTAPTAPFPDF